MRPYEWAPVTVRTPGGDFSVEGIVTDTPGMLAVPRGFWNPEVGQSRVVWGKAAIAVDVSGVEWSVTHAGSGFKLPSVMFCTLRDALATARDLGIPGVDWTQSDRMALKRAWQAATNVQPLTVAKRAASRVLKKVASSALILQSRW